MWQTLIFIILSLFISSKSVDSLICYTSDFKSLKQGNVNSLNYYPQDCEAYNNDVKLVNPLLQIPQNVTVHCYAVEVSRDIVFGGCVRSGGCGYLIDVFRDIVQDSLSGGLVTGKVECMECSNNTCNEIHFESELEQRVPASLTAHRGETSLKCYHCLEPCEISRARQKICGEYIGKSHEAMCTWEVQKNNTSSSGAIRKCQVIQKDRVPRCPDNSLCKFCKDDLCNTDNGEALKCHYCLDACEVSKATEKTCGTNIGESQEAVCSKEVPKDSKTPNVAIRKCQIVNKGTEPACTNPDCKITSCKSDLCNAAPSIGSNMAMVGVVAAYFATKFLLN